MAAPPAPLAVEVAASTSNLGPGFDLLGLAFSLPLRVRVLGPAPGPAHEIARADGEAEAWPPAGENLLLRAFDAALQAGGGGGPRVFEVRSEIPLGRGFGSSGAAVAAGLLLGAELAPRRPPLRELLARGIALEGHPDNVTASLFGGCTLSHPAPGAVADRPLVVRVELAPDLGLAVAWTDQTSTTAAARALLPERVPFADAVENPRRLALLLEGLRRGDAELVAAGGEDRLHVPYRIAAIRGGAEALEAARAAGAWTATISGAGSGLVAVGPRGGMEPVAVALEEALSAATAWAKARVVEPAAGAPRVLPDA